MDRAEDKVDSAVAVLADLLRAAVDLAAAETKTFAPIQTKNGDRKVPFFVSLKWEDHLRH